MPRRFDTARSRQPFTWNKTIEPPYRTIGMKIGRRMIAFCDPLIPVVSSIAGTKGQSKTRALATALEQLNDLLTTGQVEINQTTVRWDSRFGVPSCLPLVPTSEINGTRRGLINRLAEYRFTPMLTYLLNKLIRSIDDFSGPEKHHKSTVDFFGELLKSLPSDPYTTLPVEVVDSVAAPASPPADTWDGSPVDTWWDQVHDATPSAAAPAPVTFLKPPPDVTPPPLAPVAGALEYWGVDPSVPAPASVEFPVTLTARTTPSGLVIDVPIGGTTLPFMLIVHQNGERGYYSKVI